MRKKYPPRRPPRPRPSPQQKVSQQMADETEMPELPPNPIAPEGVASLTASDSAALQSKVERALELTDRLMQLQMQRIEQLIRLYDQEKKTMLLVLQEMRETMQVAQQMIAGLDPQMEKMGQITAALVQVVQILQQQDQ